MAPPDDTLDEEALVAARSDIQVVDDGQLRRRIRVGKQVYEIRIAAEVSRG